MRIRSTIAALLLLTTCGGLSWAHDKTAATAEEKLRAAISQTSFDGPDALPWHWTLEVTYNDADGKLSSSGTIEAWYADGKMRTVMTIGDDELTTLRIGDQLYRGGANAAKFAPFEIALMEAIHPIPDGLFDPNIKLKLVSQKVGKTKLECIETSFTLPDANTFPVGAPLSYCLTANTGQFVRASQPPQASLSRLSSESFQTKQAPLFFELTVLGQTRLQVKTAELESLTPNADTFFLSADLHRFDGPVELAQPNQMVGMMLNKDAPHYPSAAKLRRAQGTAEFDVVIGTDGRIVSKVLTNNADPDFDDAASQAITHWIFRPYLVNGIAMPVKTTITINFRLG